MSSQRRRRHHTVPRFHLSGFASDTGQLRQIDLETAKNVLVSVDNATVVKDFYTVTLEDGSTSDIWERRLADFESQVAPSLRRAISAPHWSPAAAERHGLAAWMALQFLRGTQNRRLISYARSQMLRMQVGMGGIEYLRYAMAEGMGRDVSNREVETVWDDITGGAGPALAVSGEEHIDSLTFSHQRALEYLLRRSWHRVQFRRRTLAISDTPVALIPDSDQPEWRGVGLVNAGAVTVALNRQTLLWLGEPGLPEIEFPPSTALARAHNSSVVLGAHRFVYTHPDDPAPTDGLPLPRPARQEDVPQEMDGLINRHRPLADVLAQIADHHHDPDSLIADYTWPIPGYSAPAPAQAV